MPKFFYTVLAGALIAWTWLFILGSEIAPDSGIRITIFMFSFFIAIGITLTCGVFVYFNYRASLFMNRHILFRRSLKYGYFVGFFITGILSLRAFELATTLNYILFIVLCLVLYKQFRGNRI